MHKAFIVTLLLRAILEHFLGFRNPSGTRTEVRVGTLKRAPRNRADVAHASACCRGLQPTVHENPENGLVRPLSPPIPGRTVIAHPHLAASRAGARASYLRGGAP